MRLFTVKQISLIIDVEFQRHDFLRQEFMKHYLNMYLSIFLIIICVKMFPFLNDHKVNKIVSTFL